MTKLVPSVVFGVMVAGCLALAPLEDHASLSPGSSATCDAGTCEVPPASCSGKILFVSSDQGNDGNDGCTGDRPKKTLAAALAATKNTGDPGWEVRACRGVYPERLLTVDFPVALRGGYDCRSWQRVANALHPDFDSTNDSVIENSAFTERWSTLVIKGAPVGPTAVIEGFVIKGPENTAVTTGSIAVEVLDGASPRITDNRILGGATASEYRGSVGVRVVGSASPALTDNVIDGGRGTSTGLQGAVGSIGVWVHGTGGRPSIQRNRIGGGTGRSPGTGAGSAGLFVEGAVIPADVPVVDNTIHGGGGTNEQPQAAGSVGVSVSAGGLTLSRNLVWGRNLEFSGNACGLGSPCGYVAIVLGNPSDVRIEKNRIFSANAATAGYARGISTVGGQAGTKVTVVDNFIDGGVLGASGSTAGMELAGGTTVVVERNTVFMGTGGEGHYGVIVQAKTTASIVGNLLFGGGAATYGLQSDVCGKAKIDLLSDNVFAYITQPGLFIGGSDGSKCSPPTFEIATTVKATENGVVSAGGKAMNNARVDQACSESSCYTKACTTVTECAGVLFQTWAAVPSEGYTSLFGDGWKLRDNAPCLLSRRGTARPEGPTDDAFGTARTADLSAGAHENDSASCAP